MIIESMSHQDTTTEELKQRIGRLEVALNHMSPALCMYDAQGRMIICNRRFAELHGLEKEVEKPNRTIFDFMAASLGARQWNQDPHEYVQRVMQAMREGRTFSAELEIGDRIIALVNTPLSDGGWVSTQEDVTSRIRAERQIVHLAHHDSLTNLPNRTAFNKHLASVMEASKEQSTSFAILCVDLDRFKDINDVFGHSTGDALLQEVARRFHQVADGAFFARLGGDEFTFISSEGPQPCTAAALAERILTSINGSMNLGGSHVLASLSSGVAVFPSDGADAASLLCNADAALYRAKAEGRGVVRFFEREMDARLREQRTLQHDLRSALTRKELTLHYQPQALMDGTVTGFEALARWNHPSRGLIAPATFIPLAEESGSIVEIGEWVLREACEEAASWTVPLQIAVNLSPVQFRHGDLVKLVHSILLETGLQPNRLELEITENALIGDQSRALFVLRRLKSMGIRVTMDDFGTGYSSLSYLQSFPFDKLKIDRSFLRELQTGPHSAAIIRAVIGLGHGLDLPVVAEGVETGDQLAFLSKEACDEIQGYLIGRPQPISEYADLIGCKMPNLRAGARGPT